MQRRRLPKAGPATLVAASIVLGFLFLRPVAWVFGAIEWPWFDARELGHVSWFVGWPLLSLICGVVLYAAGRPPKRAADPIGIRRPVR